MTRSPVSVVVCAYTLDRWDDLESALSSAADQLFDQDELWLVVDHNQALLDRAKGELVDAHPRLRVVPNHRKQGLSGARNTAVEWVTKDVVVFLDDDAAAEPGWLDALSEPYTDSAVIAVGGAAMPRWSNGEARPVTLPSATTSTPGELDWVVGCTYSGQPEVQQPVRNVMGCNMSFRREIFAGVGGFSEDLGRVGKTPLGCEETELCIRARAAYPGARIVFVPQALVRHHVSSDRLTWRYLRRRCYAEGLSKAAVSAMVGTDQALETERSYATRVLPLGVVREIRAALRPGELHRATRLGGAVAIVFGLSATVAGYLRGRIGRARLVSNPPQLLVEQPPRPLSLVIDSAAAH